MLWIKHRAIGKAQRAVRCQMKESEREAGELKEGLLEEETLSQFKSLALLPLL